MVTSLQALIVPPADLTGSDHSSQWISASGRFLPVANRLESAKSGRLLAGIQAMSPGPGEIAWGLRKPA